MSLDKKGTPTLVAPATCMKILELVHDKTYNKTYVTRQDSDQPWMHSLIRVFAYRMCLLQLLSYPKKDKQEPLPYLVDVQADLSFAGHTRLL